MKKSLTIIIIIFVTIIIIPFISYLIWSNSSTKDLNVYVLDKTISSYTADQHTSLFWVLQANKYVKPEGKHYNRYQDYFGFVPKHGGNAKRNKEYLEKKISYSQIFDIIDNYDALYYTDTHGVYYPGWFYETKETPNSNLIVGGLNNVDYTLLYEMKNAKKLVIVEHSVLTPPTSPLTQFQIEEHLNIKLNENGWSGTYCPSLDKSSKYIQEWMIRLYEKTSKKNWSFSNDGIIFTNKHSNRILVLETGKELTTGLPTIVTSKYGQDKFDLPATIDFPNSFEFLKTNDKNTVVSNITIPLTATGKAIFEAMNLPQTCPIILENINDVNYYYYGGDFSYIPTKGGQLLSFGFIAKFGDLFVKHSHKDFYLNFYKPLLENTFAKYYEMKKANPKKIAK